MKVEPLKVTVAELVEDYADDGLDGVTGYGGRLDIRPPFQRAFVYKDKQRDAVINTIRKGLPLNVMYWGRRDDGTFEIIDGQQRTISVAQYVAGDFSFDGHFFESQPADIRQRILDYELTVYACEGNESEKLEWFEIINIAGERLTRQELLNAVYAGPWVSDAKRRFSHPKCVAYQVGKDHLRGSPIRQDYLETAIQWAAGDKSEKTVRDYMSRHRADANAVALWNHFRSVIDWVKATFTVTRPKFMRGVDWGAIYAEYGDAKLDPSWLESETARLMQDDDVLRKAGIYLYLLSGEERHLNIRAFTPAMKRAAYERQEGLCARCDSYFPDMTSMEGDHIDPWSEGGKTNAENCQMLCKPCNRRKSNK